MYHDAIMSRERVSARGEWDAILIRYATTQKQVKTQAVLRSWRWLIVVAFMLLATGPKARAEGAPPRELTIATWNVENLFDAKDDPKNTGDDEFTTEGWRTWTPDRYSLKLGHLADVITQMNADILCVQEIENRRVLDNLCEALRYEFSMDYPYILHREGTDHRGIEVAILSKIEPVDMRWLEPVAGQRETLIARFRPDGERLTIYVNHWKSRWGPKGASTRTRLRQARAIRKDVDAVLKADPAARVLVVGDFNDDCNGSNMCDVLRVSTNKSAVLESDRGGLLYNVHGERPAHTPGTSYYRQNRVWNTFDTINVSRSLLTGNGWTLKPDSVEVFRTPDMVDEEGVPIPFRLLKDTKTKRWAYLTGYSDHLPLRVVLIKP